MCYHWTVISGPASHLNGIYLLMMESSLVPQSINYIVVITETDYHTHTDKHLPATRGPQSGEGPQRQHNMMDRRSDSVSELLLISSPSELPIFRNN